MRASSQVHQQDLRLLEAQEQLQAQEQRLRVLAAAAEGPEITTPGAPLSRKAAPGHQGPGENPHESKASDGAEEGNGYETFAFEQAITFPDGRDACCTMIFRPMNTSSSGHSRSAAAQFSSGMRPVLKSKK